MGSGKKRGAVLETEGTLFVQTPCTAVFNLFFSVARQCVSLCLYRSKAKPFAQQKGSTLVKTDEAKLLAVVLSFSG